MITYALVVAGAVNKQAVIPQCSSKPNCSNAINLVQATTIFTCIITTVLYLVFQPLVFPFSSNLNNKRHKSLSKMSILSHRFPPLTALCCSHRGQQTMVSHLFLQIKFTGTQSCPFTSYIFYVCFHIKKADLSCCNKRPHGSKSLKY